MAKTITLYKIFVSSPSDLIDERNLIEEVIEELNLSTFINSDIKVELKRWETHVNPDIGKYPQQVINKDIGDDYDIFIGLLWSRFGTKTENYGSGTEEEFYNAYSLYIKTSSPKIMFYFKQAPIPFDKINTESINSIRKFKSELGEKGVLYWEYSTSEEFQKLLRIQLNRKIHELRQDQKITPNIIQKDELLIEEEDEELGLLDYIDIGEECFQNIEEIVLRMTDAVEWIGNRFNERSEDLNRKTQLNPQMGSKTKRRLINAAADDMHSFNKRLGAEVPLFSETFRKGIDSFSNAIKISLDLKADEKEEIENTQESILHFISSIESSKIECIKFRDSVIEFPRMTKEFNQAKRSTSNVLSKIIDEFAVAINLSDALYSEFEEYKKMY